MNQEFKFVPTLFSVCLIIKKWSLGIKWCFNNKYKGWSTGKPIHQ